MLEHFSLEAARLRISSVFVCSPERWRGNDDLLTGGYGLSSWAVCSALTASGLMGAGGLEPPQDFHPKRF